MIRNLRRWWINRKIALAIHDQQWYARQSAAAMDEAERARVRESVLRQALIDIDFKLPAILRTRGLT